MTTAVEVAGLTRRFGAATAVDGVSLTVPAGQLAAVLGPNGAGKTTTVEILAGFLAPTGGTVRVLGADPRRGGRAWRARIGLVLQSTSLDAQLTVAEVLAAYAGVYPRPRPVAEVLDVVGLTAEARTRVGALSGGQRRRVDLGLGLIGRPDLLFLDEPTTGLDPEARRRVWAAVQDLTAAGTTVLLTTHYLEEAQRLADRVVVLAGGRVVADAPPEQIRTHGARPVIRWPLPPGVAAADLPAPLAAHVVRDELVLPSADVAGDLAALVGWARERRIDLAALEVGAPSLEDAYLALTGHQEEIDG